MGKLILTRGVPASGKTTFAKRWVAEAPENRARVNRDDLRAMMFDTDGKLTFAQEKAVSAAQQAAVKRLIHAHDVIVDDTNLTAKFVKMWYGLVPDIEFIDFPIDYHEAVRRDFLRGQSGGRSVGEEVIKSFFDRFVKGDNSLPPVPVNESKLVDPAPYRPGPIRAVSFDLDGTLAHMNGRSPFDPTLYHTDIVDEHVREALWNYQDMGYEVIILTARDDTHRQAVDDWLYANGIQPDLVLMRKGGDTRNDAIVKSEIVDEHISDVYDIRMHYDDRNRVVDALRDKGIKVAQVNPGDF